MKTYLLKAGVRQAIARAGETDIAVAYNAKTWVDEYPAGNPQLMVTTPGGKQVPVTVGTVDNLITGQVPNELLAGPGVYSYVFVWTSGSTQLESGRCECLVLGSNLAQDLVHDSRRTPEWAERIFLAAEVIEGAVNGAMEARNTAADKAAEAAESEANAAGSAEDAEDSATLADQKATAAAASAADAAASAAAMHPENYVAQAFSASSAYSAGTYVMHDGYLYQLTADHDADVTWENTEKTQVKVADDVGELKSDAKNITGNERIKYTVINGYYNTSEVDAEDPVDFENPTQSNNFDAAVVACHPGDVFTVSGTTGSNGRVWAFLRSNKKVKRRETENVYIDNKVIIAEEGEVWLVINNRKADTPNAVSYYGKLASARMNSMESDIVKNTSDIGSLQESLATGELSFKIIEGEWIKSDGDTDTSSTWSRTDYIPISKYAVLHARSSALSQFNCFYNANYVKVGNPFTVGTTDTRIPIYPGAAYMRLSNTNAGMANLHIIADSIPESKKIAEIIPYYDTYNTQIMLDVLISSGTVNATMVFPANWGIKIDQNHEAIYFNSDVSTTVEKTSSSRAWTVFFNASTNTFSMQTAFGRNLQLIGDDDYELFSFYYNPSDDELIVNRYSQFIRNAISYNDKTVEALNEDKIPYIVNAKRQENDWIHNVKYPEAITMAVLTDIHGNNRNFLRYLSFCKTYANYITEKVCLGDMVAHWYGDDITYWDNNPDGANILRTIGNHDVWKANVRPFENDDQADVYNTYFYGKTSVWNVTQPANADTNHLMYYYKDYADQKLRLIVLDCMYWDSAENTWFAGVLADALTNGYGVVCTSHYNLSKTDVTGIGNFYSLDYGFAGLTIGTGGQDARDAVDTFIANGGTFICWMSGDSHYDDCGIYENNGRKQITLTFENASLNSDWNDSLRVKGTKTQDSFNLVSFDTNKKLIKIVRIGNNADRYYRPKNFMTINYETHQVVVNG